MKKSILKTLLACTLACFCIGVGALSFSYSVNAVDEPAISAKANFGTMEKTEIESAGFALSNLAMAKNAVHGAVPGAAWGGSVSGGDASVLYTLDAGTGYYLSDSKLSFEVYGGHCGGIYWYNTSGKLGATMKVYVSGDNENWTEIYDLTDTVKGNAGTKVSTLESPISLSDYFTDTRYGYVKFEIKHWTAAEINENTAVSGWSGIALDKVGIKLFEINVTSERTINEQAVRGEADFVAMSKTEIENAGFTLSNLAMAKNEVYGAVPGAAWGANVSGGNASVLYTLDAGVGQKIKDGALSFDFGAGHEGGGYWYNNANGSGLHKLGSNFTVFVSTDNANWTKIFDLSDENWVQTHEQTEKSRYNNESNPISLSDYGGVRKIYLRFDVTHFTNTEIDELWGIDCSKGIPLNRLGFNLFKIDVVGETEKDVIQKDDCRVKTMQILLGGRIDVKFGLLIREEVAADKESYVSLTFGKENKSLYVSDLTVNERGYYEIIMSVVPAQMTEQIKMQVISGEYSGKEFCYTLREYAVELIEKNEDDQKTALLKAMLNYGAYAQQLFAVNTDNLANKGYGADISSVSIDKQTNISGSATGVGDLSCELFLQADSSIRIYFAAATAENFKASVSFANADGQNNRYELDVVGSNSECYVEIPHIPADMLDTVYSLTIENLSDGSSTIIEVSAESCMASYIKNGGAEQQNVAKAMYLYCIAAKNYVA